MASPGVAKTIVFVTLRGAILRLKPTGLGKAFRNQKKEAVIAYNDVASSQEAFGVPVSKVKLKQERQLRQHHLGHSRTAAIALSNM